MNISVIILLAIVLAIGLGFAFKINVGLFGILFAYFIGVFGLGMSVKAVTATWSLTLFFTIFAITFFYGFAISNGTLELIAKKSVYLTRNVPYLIPFVCYGLCIAMSGIGPGPYAVYAFLSPLIMAIAKEIKMHKMIAVVGIVGGGVAGAFTSIGMGGGIAKGLIEGAGYVQEAAQFTNRVLINSFIGETILFIIVYIVFKGYKVKPSSIEKPVAFNREQKINMILIVLTLALTIFPTLFSNLVPDSAMLKTIAKGADVAYVCILGAILGIFFKIGKEKAAFAIVPWNTIILLCGMGMLVSVAVAAGTIDMIANAISTNVSKTTAPVVMTILAGAMSFFSSTMGVVMPTLYPVVPTIVAATGVAPTALFSVITLGAAVTGVSPFSSGGGLALPAIQDEQEKAVVFKQLLILPFASLAVIAILVLVGIIR